MLSRSVRTATPACASFRTRSRRRFSAATARADPSRPRQAPRGKRGQAPRGEAGADDWVLVSFSARVDMYCRGRRKVREEQVRISAIAEDTQRYAELFYSRPTTRRGRLWGLRPPACGTPW